MDWLAISVQGEVEKYGVYVGIAAFFGLAVLSLLYFAQARELKRLREWAGRAPERAQELEERAVANAEAARQAGPVRRLAEMPVVPPPPVPAATAAAAAEPQATVEADVLKEADEEEAAAAPSTNGHHAGPVPPPDTTVGAPDRDEDESPSDEDAEKAAVGAGAAEQAREASEEDDAAGPATGEVEAVDGGQDAASDGGEVRDADEDGAPAAADETTVPAAESAPAREDVPEAGEATVEHPAVDAPEEPAADEDATEEAADDDTRIHLPEESADDIRVRAMEREAAAEVERADAAEAEDGSDVDEPDSEPEPGEEDGEPAVLIPRATPAQRPLTVSRPGTAALSRSQPSASPRRPGGPPPRRTGGPTPDPGRRSVGTVALLAGIAVLVMGAGAFAASQLLGSDDGPQPPNRTSQPATASPTATAAQDRGAKPPAETVVAVLNGTTFNGLAGTIADQLGRAGYQRGATITNPDQSLQTSTVFFADGARANARRIARRLNVSDVRALDASTQALAPDADVIVLAGADQAP
jgi:hypothetical protein